MQWQKERGGEREQVSLFVTRQGQRAAGKKKGREARGERGERERGRERAEESEKVPGESKGKGNSGYWQKQALNLLSKPACFWPLLCVEQQQQRKLSGGDVGL